MIVATNVDRNRFHHDAWTLLINGAQSCLKSRSNRLYSKAMPGFVPGAPLLPNIKNRTVLAGWGAASGRRMQPCPEALVSLGPRFPRLLGARVHPVIVR